MVVFLAFFGALGISWSGVPLVRRWAVRFSLLSHPNGIVETHVKPVPYLGGVAIFLGFLPFALVAAFLYDWATGMLVGAGATFILGLVDDAKVLSPMQKFVGQVVASVVAIGLGLRFDLSSNEYLAVAIAMVWLVGMSNALNLVDMMDGLSAGVGTVAALGFSAVAFWRGQEGVALIALALGGALLGFLRYNFDPARIFMGDAGSLFVGFVLGSVGILIANGGGEGGGRFIPLLMLGVPIFEMTFVSAMRLKQRRSIFRASRDHVAQRMLKLNLSVRQTVCIAYLVGAFLATDSILSLFLNPRWDVANFCVICALAVGVGWRLSAVDVSG